MRTFAALLAAVSLAVPVCATAQTISIRVVLDSGGAPAANAVVMLMGDSARVIARMRTTGDGIASAILDRPGTYRLAFYIGTASFITPPLALDWGASLEREFRVPAGPGAVQELFLDAEVTKPARLRPDARPPLFPPGKARPGQHGIVRALFVVNDEGRAVMNTVQFIGASDKEFLEPVMRSLRNARFHPAEREGHAVRQLMQLTYDFACMGVPPVGEVTVRSFDRGCR